MRQISSEEIKKLEFDLLLAFRDLCEENNLYYTLCGGTLLGAIRHKGFIPWDDDIDVLMPRPDYDRLLNNQQINKLRLSDNYSLANWKEGTHDYPFLKLVDMRTTVSIPYVRSTFKADHIWIDIFPIDGNPDNDTELKRLFQRASFWRQLIRLKTANPNAGKSKFRKLMKPLLVAGVKRVDNAKLCERLDAIAKTYDFEEQAKIGGVLWGYGPQERIDKEKYLTPVKVEFEGEFFNAPSNYNEYLSGLYGDYMKLPPEKDRVTHEITCYIDD